jgi:hypothetical protein
MSYLKHKAGQPPKKRESKEQTQPAPVAMPDYSDAGQSVADAINHFASIFSTYVTQARNGDNGASLYTEPSGYPVKVALVSTADNESEGSLTLYVEGDAVESIADSLKRIADVMTATRS